VCRAGNGLDVEVEGVLGELTHAGDDAVAFGADPLQVLLGRPFDPDLSLDPPPNSG
jgi:hypothetical protein